MNPIETALSLYTVKQLQQMIDEGEFELSKYGKKGKLVQNIRKGILDHAKTNHLMYQLDALYFFFHKCSDFDKGIHIYEDDLSDSEKMICLEFIRNGYIWNVEGVLWYPKKLVDILYEGSEDKEKHFVHVRTNATFMLNEKINPPAMLGRIEEAVVMSRT